MVTYWALANVSERDLLSVMTWKGRDSIRTMKNDISFCLPGLRFFNAICRRYDESRPLMLLMVRKPVYDGP